MAPFVLSRGKRSREEIRLHTTPPRSPFHRASYRRELGYDVAHLVRIKYTCTNSLGTVGSREYVPVAYQDTAAVIPDHTELGVPRPAAGHCFCTADYPLFGVQYWLDLLDAAVPWRRGIVHLLEQGHFLLECRRQGVVHSIKIYTFFFFFALAYYMQAVVFFFLDFTDFVLKKAWKPC